MRFGIRLHTISRDSSAEAWAEAQRLLDALDPEAIAKAQSSCARASRSASSGCSRCTAARRDELEINPNLWAGVGLVRGGAGTALVGSHEEVADRIEEYHALGIDEFISPATPTSKRRTGSVKA